MTQPWSWLNLVAIGSLISGCSATSSPPPSAPQYPPGSYQGAPPPSSSPGPEYPPGAYQSPAPAQSAPSPAPAAPPAAGPAPPPATTWGSPSPAPAPVSPSNDPAVTSPPRDPCGYDGYCPYDAPCVPKHPPPECSQWRSDRHVAMFVEGLVLRVGGYRLRGGPSPRETYGFLLTIDPDTISRGSVFNARGTLYAAIGGGSAGLEGQFEGASTAGAHLGREAGVLFLRGGFGFQVLGNNDLYRSHLELPRLETGYQVFGDEIVFELQGNAGLVLGGRYNVGDGAKRRIDTVPRVGASATLQNDDLRFHVAANRIFAFSTGNGAPIDQLALDVCGQLGKIVIACAHGAGHRGHVHWRDGTTSLSTALYAGGTIGVGAIDVK